jgi:hypothetical protein
MVKRTFRMPGSMPDHIFLNNNCHLAPIAKKEDIFKNIGLSVDVSTSTASIQRRTDTARRAATLYVFLSFWGEMAKDGTSTRQLLKKLMSGWEGII